jgi:hypothetical protein
MGSTLVSDALPFVQDRRWSDAQLDLAAFLLLLKVVRLQARSDDTLGPRLVREMLASQFVPLLGSEAVHVADRAFVMHGMPCARVLAW